MKKRGKSPVFFIIYEGETEKIFLKELFQRIGSNFTKFPISLRGVDHTLSKKAASKFIDKYEDKKAEIGSRKIYAIILYDRDSLKPKPGRFNIDHFRRIISEKKIPLEDTFELIATKELEAWFFYDMDGIYEYVGVPKKNRKYNYNPDYQDSRTLNQIFKLNSKYYRKGLKSEGLIKKLDLLKISKDCPEILECLEFIREKTG